MAHAVHPNYAERHDAKHGPTLGGGLVLKHNANQRYATNAVGAALVRACGARAGVPVQEFAVKADAACGTTIGPITAAGTGVRTVDVGPPQLSMHSCREMMHADDVRHGVKVG
jgi:aspartyl aminopeptidase